MSVIYNGPDTSAYQTCQKYPNTAYCYCNATPDACAPPPISLTSLCSQGNNAAQNYNCTNWLSSWCTPDRMGDSLCQKYAQSTAAKGQIDDNMKVYCASAAGRDSDLCSCINSPVGFCANKFDKNCIKKNGYETYDMISTSCPDYLTCKQQVNLSTGALAVLMNVSQTCSTGATATIEDELKGPLSDTIDNPYPNNSFINTIFSWPLYLFLIIFLFILLITAAISSGSITSSSMLD
jgi:hypothetical protein